MPARDHASTTQETRLSRLRVEEGMTQRQLAEAAGISYPTLRRLESGTITNPPLRYLVNLSLALGCSLDDLIEDEWREWWLPTE